MDNIYFIDRGKYCNIIILNSEMVYKIVRCYLNKFYIIWNYIIILDCSYNVDGLMMVGRLMIVIKFLY